MFHLRVHLRLGIFLLVTVCAVAHRSHAFETDAKPVESFVEVARPLRESIDVSSVSWNFSDPVRPEISLESQECDLFCSSENSATLQDERLLSTKNDYTTFGEWSFFTGLDGSKQPQDLGVNANLGGRVGVDWGGLLSQDLRLGIHIGTSIVASTNAVQVFEALGASSNRTQYFSTVGLFQRLPGGFLWAAGHDFLYQDAFDSLFLSQWRCSMGVELSQRDEIGVRAAISGLQENADFLGTSIPFRSVNQGNFYWRHQWPSAGQTSIWMGLVNSHAESNAALGPLPRRQSDFLIGADLLLPLTDRIAIYGETNLIMPPDSGTVDAYLGIAFYPSGIIQARRRSFSPVLSPASSTTFSVDAGW